MIAHLALLALLGLAQAESPAPDRARAVEALLAREELITADITVAVGDRDKAAAALLAAAEARGGWFLSRHPDHVILRIPAEQVQPWLDLVPEQGRVLSRSYQAQSQKDELAELRSRLVAREAVLQQYMDLLGNANAKAVVTVERELTRQISEVEELRGRIRKLEHQVRYASVTLRFQYQERRAPGGGRPSSFAWINEVTLQDLTSDARSGRLDARVRGAELHLPPGMAPLRKSHAAAALSPESVVMRARRMKNKPASTLAFWREALELRLKDQGYKVLESSPIQGKEGHLIELSAPLGPEDWLWLVAIYVEGRHILVVEAAGPAAQMQARRADLVSALGQSGP